jgi:beta-glucanase (GH16 family)
VYADPTTTAEPGCQEESHGQETHRRASRQSGGTFHEPHYIPLNLALGGTNGGDPSATEFPARFEVDYVRVYQKQAAP